MIILHPFQSCSVLWEATKMDGINRLPLACNFWYVFTSRVSTDRGDWGYGFCSIGCPLSLPILRGWLCYSIAVHRSSQQPSPFKYTLWVPVPLFLHFLLGLHCKVSLFFLVTEYCPVLACFPKHCPQLCKPSWINQFEWTIFLLFCQGSDRYKNQWESKCSWAIRHTHTHPNASAHPAKSLHSNIFPP